VKHKIINNKIIHIKEIKDSKTFDKKDIWKASAAKTHCKGRGGKFEAAKDAEDTKPEKLDDKTGGTMKLSLKTIEFEREIDLEDEETLKTFQDDLDDNLKTIFEEHEETEKQLKEIREVLPELDVEKAKELKVNAEDGIAYRKYLTERIVSFSTSDLLGLVENDEVKIQEQKDILAKLDLKQLRSQHDNLLNQINKKYPAYGILPENVQDMSVDDKKKDKDKKIQVIPDSRYQMD